MRKHIAFGIVATVATVLLGIMIWAFVTLMIEAPPVAIGFVLVLGGIWAIIWAIEELSS